MADENPASFDFLDPFSPGVVMEYAIAAPLTRELQLDLQRKVRERIERLLRGILQDYPNSGVVIPENLFLVEVTVEQGSITAIVRFSRPATVALLLAIGGCQQIINNPPSYDAAVGR